MRTIFTISGKPSGSVFSFLRVGPYGFCQRQGRAWRIAPLLFWAGLALAQTTTPATTPPATPQTWVGAGISYGPHWQGWASFATLVNKTTQAYSYTTMDFTPRTSSVTQSSMRTGLATPIFKFGNAILFGLADVGVASAGTTTTGALSGRGMLIIPIGKWTISIGGGALKAGSVSQIIWELGPGRVIQ